MSLAVLNSRIKKMECENKPIPQKYIDCFNDYIKKVINTRVDQEVEYLNDIIADKFELGKFKSVNELIYAYKSLEKEYTKSRQRIADLEAKLAESENAMVLDYSTGKWRKICEIQEENKQLKQQLAEKEKEIFFYQNVLRPKPETATEICELIRPYALKLEELSLYKDRFESLYNHYNQDKISFAVEQLEKVKLLIENKLVEFDNTEMKMIMGLFAFNITCQIDNQIAELKKGE